MDFGLWLKHTKMTNIGRLLIIILLLINLPFIFLRNEPVGLQKNFQSASNQSFQLWTQLLPEFMSVTKYSNSFFFFTVGGKQAISNQSCSIIHFSALSHMPMTKHSAPMFEVVNRWIVLTIEHLARLTHLVKNNLPCS